MCANEPTAEFSANDDLLLALVSKPLALVDFRKLLVYLSM